MKAARQGVRLLLLPPAEAAGSLAGKVGIFGMQVFAAGQHEAPRYRPEPGKSELAIEPHRAPGKPWFPCADVVQAADMTAAQ